MSQAPKTSASARDGEEDHVGCKERAQDKISAHEYQKEDSSKARSRTANACKQKRPTSCLRIARHIENIAGRLRENSRNRLVDLQSKKQF